MARQRTQHDEHRAHDITQRVSRNRDLPSRIARYNTWLAVKVTKAVGSMWCAYAFAIMCLIGLPDAIEGGTATVISWIAQTFLQLVLLSVIMVGQNAEAEAAGQRSEAMFDAMNKSSELLLKRQAHTEEHLAAQVRTLVEIALKLGIDPDAMWTDSTEQARELDSRR